MRDDDIPQGEKIGAYRIVRRLSRGPIADVWLAKAEGPLGFERTVTLKRLADRHPTDSAVARTFATEAAAYAKLSHPSIVRLFDFFSHDDELVMVLEHVDGPTLEALVAAATGAGLTVPDGAALYVAICLFEGLAKAHAVRDDDGLASPIVHRGVSPATIQIAFDGDVKLADFGVAKVTGVRSETEAGALKGTLGYMAPEQVKGKPIGPHTDVYAAGVLVWELLARRPAFKAPGASDFAVLKAMAEPSLPSLDELRRDLDRRVREVVGACLIVDDARRVVTAAEVARTLRDVCPPETGRGELVELVTKLRGTLEPRDEPEGTRPSWRSSVPDETSADTLLDSLFSLDAPHGPDSAATPPKAPEVDAPSPAKAVAAPPSPKSPSPPPAAPLPTPTRDEPRVTEASPRATAPLASAPRSGKPEVDAADADLVASLHAAPASTSKPRPTHRPVSPPAAAPRTTGGFAVTYGIVAVALLALSGLVYAKRAAVAEIMLDHPTEPVPFVPSDPFPPHEAPIVLPPTADARAAAPSPSATTDPPAPSGPVPRDTGPTDAGPRDAILDTSPATPGHRIFVDGKVVGETPQRVVVPCGKRTIQLGKGAPVRTLDLACGKTTPLGDK
ncbi:MAG: protein kinase [Myxococcales bacterium]|nr:protein kinase [Myxococcales bacterium]